MAVLNINIDSPTSGIAIGDTVTNGTEGSVLFLGASGVLAQDNDNFFWDNTNNRLGIGTKTPTAIVHAKAKSATDIVSIFQGTTAQSGNLTEWRNVSDTVVASVDVIGYMTASHFKGRGLFDYVNTYNNAYSCFYLNQSNGNTTVYQRLNFHGETSAFPSLKRSGTELQVRLADDSDYAKLSTAFIGLKSYTYATLPASPSAGDLAFVTDALSDPRGRYYFTLSGGGSYGVKVLYTGTAWVYA